MMRIVALSIVLLGCSSDGGHAGGSLDDTNPAVLSSDPAMAGWWIQRASAPIALYLAEMPVGLANLYADTTDPCPRETVSGDVTTYEAGCTDGNGQQWSGMATVTGTPSADFFYGTSIAYDGFQAPSTIDCGGTEYTFPFVYDGTVTIEQASNGGGTFDIDITYEGDSPDPTNNCQPRAALFALEYHGSVQRGSIDSDGDGASDDWTWNGSGRFGGEVTGSVTLATTDEYIDKKRCEDEALSGTTSIQAGSHTIDVTYDGATDCDSSGTVKWSFDGADQGEIEGVSCNAGGGSGGALIVLALVGLVRRRTR